MQRPLYACSNPSPIFSKHCFNMNYFNCANSERRLACPRHVKVRLHTTINRAESFSFNQGDSLEFLHSIIHNNVFSLYMTCKRNLLDTLTMFSWTWQLATCLLPWQDHAYACILKAHLYSHLTSGRSFSMSASPTQWVPPRTHLVDSYLHTPVIQKHHSPSKKPEMWSELWVGFIPPLTCTHNYLLKNRTAGDDKIDWML
jgi:hypothetical protein